MIYLQTVYFHVYRPTHQAEAGTTMHHQKMPFSKKVTVGLYYTRSQKVATEFKLEGRADWQLVHNTHLIFTRSLTYERS